MTANTAARYTQEAFNFLLLKFSVACYAVQPVSYFISRSILPILQIQD